MKNFQWSWLTVLFLFFLSACTTSSTPTPTQALEPSPTSGPELARATPLPTFQNPLVAGTPTLPSPSSTQSPSTAAVTNATPIAASSAAYAVVLVSKNNTLTIRQNPGKGSKAIGSLAYNASNIRLTGNKSSLQDEKWVEIQSANGSGWVNAAYLTQSIQPSFFCNDAEVKALLTSFTNALKKKDAAVFQSLVSQDHGLKLKYLRGGAIANYSPAQVGWLFSSTYLMHWGAAPGSGMEVTGSFTQIILLVLQMSPIVHAPLASQGQLSMRRQVLVLAAPPVVAKEPPRGKPVPGAPPTGITILPPVPKKMTPPPPPMPAPPVAEESSPLLLFPQPAINATARLAPRIPAFIRLQVTVESLRDMLVYLSLPVFLAGASCR